MLFYNPRQLVLTFEVPTIPFWVHTSCWNTPKYHSNWVNYLCIEYIYIYTYMNDVYIYICRYMNDMYIYIYPITSFFPHSYCPIVSLYVSHINTQVLIHPPQIEPSTLGFLWTRRVPGWKIMSHERSGFLLQCTGWWFQPPWKKSQWERIIPYITENKKCLKPPTRRNEYMMMYYDIIMYEYHHVWTMNVHPP